MYRIEPITPHEVGVEISSVLSREINNLIIQYWDGECSVVPERKINQALKKASKKFPGRFHNDWMRMFRRFGWQITEPAGIMFFRTIKFSTRNP